MTDVVSPDKRSQMMSGIRARDTNPELIIRRNLHARGFRYRLHNRLLPGTPDLVFARYRAVVFVHGCFWHRHDCHLFKWPSTRTEFWRAKIDGNVKRDRLVLDDLAGQGWRVLVIWECALKGRTRRPVDEVITATEEWLRGDCTYSELEGKRADKCI